MRPSLLTRLILHIPFGRIKPPTISTARSIIIMSSTPNPAVAFWEERYSQSEFAYGTEPNDFLKETVGSLQLNTGKCLLLADGEGRNGVFMAEQGFDEVVSVDYSAAGLEKGQALAKTRNVSITTVQADLAEYDLGKEQWDCIVGIFCHLPPPIRTKVLAEIPASLKSGGHVIFECYTPDQLSYKTGGPPDAQMMFSKKMLADALDSSLQIIRNEELVRDVVEGNYHTGKGAVVQFIGKKK